MVVLGIANSRLPSFTRCSLPPPAAGAAESTGGGIELRQTRLPKRITSVSNPLVKHCVKLRQSPSYRRASRSAIVVGLTPILEICKFQRSKYTSDEVEDGEDNGECSLVDCLLLLDGAEAPEDLRLPSAASVLNVNPAVMKRVSGLESSDSIEAIALMKFPRSFCIMDQDEGLCQDCFPSAPRRILVLDGIQDPGNLGTLIRSAMAFKWDGAFLLPSCCDPFNEKALRAARGASFQLPIVSGNWTHLISLTTKFKMKMLAGHPEDGGNESMKTSSLSRQLAESLSLIPLCLVLGSEGHGLSEQAVNSCELISIPMEGSFESLNVSVAGDCTDNAHGCWYVALSILMQIWKVEEFCKKTEMMELS